MTREAFCFLCEQYVAILPDGHFREHSPHDPRGHNVVAIRRCTGSDLSPQMTRTIAAHAALRPTRPKRNDGEPGNNQTTNGNVKPPWDHPNRSAPDA